MGWLDGAHLTGDWGGARDAMAEHGVTIEADYAAEVFEAHGHAALLGHVDASVLVDGLWKGMKFYVLGQNNHGDSVDLGSATQVSNLEAPAYTQLSEVFVDQLIGDVDVRVGKQDANRDFGTPRFGGNFINNNFGMFPTAPLPSYPTNGLGVSAGYTHDWLSARAAIYDGQPQLDNLALHGGYMVAGVVAATQELGGRDTGTQSVGVWEQRAMGMRDAGFYVQLDERFYRHPFQKDETGLTVILRFSWAQAEKTDISRYLGGSAAYHGLGMRHDDTVGLGGGYMAVGTADEYFVEAFYKWRLTAFASLQPDVEFYRHPDGTHRDALMAGARVKLKL